MKEFLKTIFFKPAWYAIFVNPYFIARRNLYRDIYKFSKTITRKKILDLGCGSKPYASLFADNDYLGIDVHDSGHKNSSKDNDIFFDGKTIPFADNSFDVVICTQVLEHAQEPETLVREARRVLKSSGIFYVTCPFVWQEHEVPYDFRRYTQFGLKRILENENFRIEKITSTNGIFSTAGQLVSSFLFEMVGKNLFLRLIMAISFCFLIQLFSVMLDFLFRYRGINLDYIVTAKKYDL